MGQAVAVAVLDPDKNISTNPGPAGGRVALRPDEDDYSPGRFHRQFRGASTDGSWGYEWGRCGKMTLVRMEGRTLRLLPALCGTWACNLCGIRRAAWLKQQINAAQMRDGLDNFWTLPVWTELCTAQDSFPFVKKSWNHLATDLRREYGTFGYCWTVEATKRGYAHLHLLTALPLSQRELSDRWTNATGGSYIVSAESVASERAASYLSKYCVQHARLRAQPGWEHLKGSAQFGKARSVQFEPFRQPGEGWAVVPVPYWTVADHVRRGLTVSEEVVAGVPRLAVEATGGGDDLVAYCLDRAVAADGTGDLTLDQECCI
jgi:hypothetical protein